MRLRSDRLNDADNVRVHRARDAGGAVRCAALCAGVVFMAMLVAWSCSAQSKQPPPTQETPAKAPVSYRVPLIAEGLHLADFAGMQPRPELKDKLQEIGGFTQAVPNDGQPATQKTEVWLGYTKSAIYFVFICHDDHPGLIRGHLARRENILNDDFISVLLDPFEDRRKGVTFRVNPMGVQADAAWTENNNPDYSYDQVWDSEGRVTPDGWMALVEIPFRSLRFRPNGSNWGVVLMRSLPRNSEWDYWPRVSANVSVVAGASEVRVV